MGVTDLLLRPAQLLRSSFLGTLVPLYGPRRDPTRNALSCSKAKLALVGDADVFCATARFDKWAATMREPARCEVMRGPEVASRCGSGTRGQHA